MRLAVACLCLAASPAWAAPIETQDIITAVTGDWDGDGGPDLALIVQTAPTEPMDLHLFLRDLDHNYLKPAEVVHGQIYGEWNGHDRPGYENSDTEPGLSALPNGSIKLDMPAMPVGSERTDWTFTLAYRDARFIVAGFSFHYEDYLKDNTASDCEVNVLTGKGQSSRAREDGTVETKTVAVTGRMVPFADWNPNVAYDACQF